MRRAQGLLASERRHTLRAPHLFGNQPAPLRPCFSASFSLRHRATLLCDDHSPQDAVHVALTNYVREHWTLPGENPPIGLILSSEKNEAVAHYAFREPA